MNEDLHATRFATGGNIFTIRHDCTPSLERLKLNSDFLIFRLHNNFMRWPRWNFQMSQIYILWTTTHHTITSRLSTSVVISTTPRCQHNSDHALRSQFNYTRYLKALMQRPHLVFISTSWLCFCLVRLRHGRVLECRRLLMRFGEDVSWYKKQSIRPWRVWGPSFSFNIAKLENCYLAHANHRLW